MPPARRGIINSCGHEFGSAPKAGHNSGLAAAATLRLPAPHRGSGSIGWLAWRGSVAAGCAFPMRLIAPRTARGFGSSCCDGLPDARRGGRRSPTPATCRDQLVLQLWTAETAAGGRSRYATENLRSRCLRRPPSPWGTAAASAPSRAPAPALAACG